jgi:hypothetical protein
VSVLPPDDELELADELANLGDEPLRLEAIDPETGERVEGYISRKHLAQAMVERDEL